MDVVNRNLVKFDHYSNWVPPLTEHVERCSTPFRRARQLPTPENQNDGCAVRPSGRTTPDFSLTSLLTPAKSLPIDLLEVTFLIMPVLRYHGCSPHQDIAVQPSTAFPAVVSTTIGLADT